MSQQTITLHTTEKYSVRCITINNARWYILSDLLNALNLFAKSTKDVFDLCGDGHVGNYKLDNNGEQRSVKVVDEFACFKIISDWSPKKLQSLRDSLTTYAFKLMEDKLIDGPGLLEGFSEWSSGGGTGGRSADDLNTEVKYKEAAERFVSQVGNMYNSKITLVEDTIKDMATSFNKYVREFDDTIKSAGSYNS